MVLLVVECEGQRTVGEWRGIRQGREGVGLARQGREGVGLGIPTESSIKHANL